MLYQPCSHPHYEHRQTLVLLDVSLCSLPQFIKAPLSAIFNLTCPPAASQSPLTSSVVCCSLQTMLTAISMSAIATNGVVPGECESGGGGVLRCVCVWWSSALTLLCVCVCSRRFVLHDLSLPRARVWWSCWDLLLLRHHFCRCHVHSWLYWNSAGK